jgi:hypothetical protein
MANVIYSKINAVPDPRFDPANLTPEQRERYARYKATDPMSQFPACKHKKHKAKGPRKDGLRWLARSRIASSSPAALCGASSAWRCGRCFMRSSSASIRTSFTRGS